MARVIVKLLPPTPPPSPALIQFRRNEIELRGGWSFDRSGPLDSLLPNSRQPEEFEQPGSIFPCYRVN